MQLTHIYPNNLKNWDLDLAKAPGFDPSKTTQYYNMESFSMVKSRELSLKSKTNFSSCLGIHRFIIFFCLSLFFLSAEEPYQIIEDQTKIPILTPSFAERETAKLRLSNGLEAILISDPLATKSAAALMVNTGSWEDPVEYPGLAHFLEHMLFLGTEKYPIESDYDHYIKEHNGKSNAYTAGDHTLYLFSINNDAFEEALDRFSFFFKKPLFNPSGVSRELQAIDQEFAKNLNQDDFREHYVQKELGNPKHPFHRFNSGNSATLLKVSQKTLKQWYQNHYSANLMRLVIYSPLPIDTLKKLVAKDFKGIPNSDRIRFSTEQIPIIPDTLKSHFIYITPVKNIRALRLTWELPPDFAKMNETKPESLVCYVLGDEAEGSLLLELKKEQLAENLICSGYHFGSNHLLFSIYIVLTEEGLKKVDTVIDRCFEAISQLGQEEFPFFLFEEYQKMSTIRYQYQSREDPFETFMKWGEWLTLEDLATFPEHTEIIQRFDPDAVKAFLKELTPENVIATILAPPETTGIEPDKKEKWIGVSYTVRPFSESQRERFKNVQPSLQLPKPNPFIPKNLNLPQALTQTLPPKIPHPDILIDNEKAKIYFAKDIDFLMPQTLWFFEIKTPLIDQGNPKQMVLTDLYLKCLEESLVNESYQAKMADLEYTLESIENGISLNIQGYSDNAEILFKIISEKLRNCNPPKELFDIFKDSLTRRYQNFDQESVLEQGFEFYKSLIYQRYPSLPQKAKAIDQITYEDFLLFSKEIFDKTYVKGLFYGNVEKEQAENAWKTLQTALKSQPYPIDEHHLTQVIVLSDSQGPNLIEIKTKSPGLATILGIENEGFSFKMRAAQQILSQAMSGPFYSTLRTQQQTGYIVYNRAEELEKHLFSFFAVQSNTHDPRDLLARFELFIEGFLQEMSKTELTEERFETIRQALVTTMENPPQNLMQMGELLKILAFHYEGDFDWISKRIQGLKELTYDEFLDMSSELLGKGNRRRLAILIKGSLSEELIFKYHQLKNPQELRQMSQYTGLQDAENHSQLK